MATKRVSEKDKKPEVISIKVENVSKTFNVPHEKHTSLKSAALNMLAKKSYEKFEALKDISFEIKKGEFFGIIGRNGSGKSTLLKMLAGIYVPDSGKITINGKLSPFLELGVGFNPELTGRENLFLGGAILGLSNKEISEKYDKIVAFSELEEFIDMKLKNYSSGMQVRLAFTLAINAHAEILLMDEVLAVGDTNFQAKCIDEFNRYKREGKTVVLVSHDLGTIQRYCDRVMLLDKSVVQYIGDADVAVEKYIELNITSSVGSGEEDGARANYLGSEIKIKAVEFLSKEFQATEAFRSGDEIVARIHFASKKVIKNPVVGVAVYSSDGVNIYGPNTKTSNFKIESLGNGSYVDFVIVNNRLFSGTYFFTVGIFDESGVRAMDFINKGFSFKVISSEKNQNGLIKLDVSWNYGKEK